MDESGTVVTAAVKPYEPLVYCNLWAACRTMRFMCYGEKFTGGMQVRNVFRFRTFRVWV